MSDGKNYLAPLAKLAPKAEADVPVLLECYGMMSDGLKALYAERDAKRDLMVAMLGEPERAKQQMIEMLSAAPLPAPTAASSREIH
jgi:hypothetical protein